MNIRWETYRLQKSDHRPEGSKRVPTLVWYCICKIITCLTGRMVLFWRWTVREWKEGGGIATTPQSRIELWTQTFQSDPAGLLGHLSLGLILLLPPPSSHSCMHLAHNPAPRVGPVISWAPRSNPGGVAPLVLVPYSSAPGVLWYWWA